jgi:hypothetical protein
VLIVNPGSVGCPAYADPTPPSPHVSETGSPHARYALLAQQAGRWRVDLVAVGIRLGPGQRPRGGERPPRLGARPGNGICGLASRFAPRFARYRRCSRRHSACRGDEATIGAVNPSQMGPKRRPFKPPGASPRPCGPP